jgi:hypothetical protein
VMESLANELISVCSLGGGHTTADAISAGTMHRMKGLEYRCLAVVGVNEHQVPAPNVGPGMKLLIPLWL